MSGPAGTRRSRVLACVGVGPALLAGLLAVVLSASPSSAAAAADRPPAERDPFIAFNRPVYRFNDALDRRLVRPVAITYQEIVPPPVQHMVVNFFENLLAPRTIAGAMLQADVQRTLVASSRFVINSTLGMAGLFDPAGDMGLEDPREDIGQALEVWGLTNSPYLVLPVLGPMTLVELPDRALASYLPQALMGHYYAQELRVLDLVSYRADVLAATNMVSNGSLDNYTFTRDAYLQRRRFLRYNGEPPAEDWDKFLDGF